MYVVFQFSFFIFFFSHTLDNCLPALVGLAGRSLVRSVGWLHLKEEKIYLLGVVVDSATLYNVYTTTITTVWYTREPYIKLEVKRIASNDATEQSLSCKNDNKLAFLYIVCGQLPHTHTHSVSSASPFMLGQSQFDGGCNSVVIIYV